MESWRAWEPVLPALERRHDVLAPTLAGHAGGPPFDAAAGVEGVVDALERAMDAAGFETAHVAGNSLGGHLAFRLAARGRARTVVAFAPAGGWPAGDASHVALLAGQRETHAQTRAAAAMAESLVATPEGRRRASELTTVNWEHLPGDLLAHLIRAAAACDAPSMLDVALRDGYDLDAEQVRCPVRLIWGTEDRLLPLPANAVRYRRDWFPTADWIELDDVGHAPQRDVPIVAAQLILDFTAG
jgi:pimeloyl-ACP methyl ester carboxylesterase